MHSSLDWQAAIIFEYKSFLELICLAIEVKLISEGRITAFVNVIKGVLTTG